jgi:hypothetical protein
VCDLLGQLRDDFRALHRNQSARQEDHKAGDDR